MRGPRSIAESLNSTQHGRFSTSASINALSLSTSHAGSRSGELSLQLLNEGAYAREGVAYNESARALVEKYERMCTPIQGNGLGQTRIVQGHRARERPILPQKDEVHKTMSKKNKSRSPLRQSIRNLLSALRKGAARSGEVIGARPGLRNDVNGVDSSSPPRVPEKNENDHTHRANERTLGYTCLKDPQAELPAQPLLSSVIKPGATEIRTDDQGKVDLSGHIWHLSTLRLLEDSRSPVEWILCNGIVKSRTLTVTSFIHPDVGPHVLELDLSRCIDVRPLASAELETEELVALSSQDETRELRAFEVVLPGREKEKFAVRNLGERAAWISALW